MTARAARWWHALVVAAIACGGTSPYTPAASSDPPYTFSGGDGSDCGQRVMIGSTTDPFVGVIAEYRWLGLHHPGYRLVEQALTYCDGAKTDIMTVAKPDGSRASVYFDVSAFVYPRAAREQQTAGQQPPASRQLRPLDSPP